MKRFARLFTELDRTTRTSEKVAALESYFVDADPKDAAWALYFLLGKRGRRPIRTALMRAWVAEASGYPDWLVEDCYDTVGDLAETLALLMNATTMEPGPEADRPVSFSDLIELHVLPLADGSEADQKRLFVSTLTALEQTERFLFLKLLTGGFRMGASRTLVIRALANVAGLSSAVMQHRLMGKWEPTAQDFKQLMNATASERDPAQPYPFYLASPIEQNVEPITDPTRWQAEWKWDGIRAQLIRRDGQTILWSRGEEVITSAYPEIELSSRALADGTVLDGELLAWRDDRPLSFNALQKRLGRKHTNRNVQAATPVVFMAYDILEHQGADIRNHPLSARRHLLEQVIDDAGKGFTELAEVLFPPEEVQGELFLLNDTGEWKAGNEVSADVPPLNLDPSQQKKTAVKLKAHGAAEPQMERRSPDRPLGTSTNVHADQENGAPVQGQGGHRGDAFSNGSNGTSGNASVPLSPRERVGVSGGTPMYPTRPGASSKARLALLLSPLVVADTMDELAKIQQSARELPAEGLMLKRRDSLYGVGRERGHWWKWKVAPFTIDAVLIAAQPGHGKRAGLFTDYTFGVWKGNELVSFAKAYFGLTDAEIQQVDRWVRENTTGRHGPVRTVKPELVFELAFEGIQESGRHRSGFALRFPRIARWRHDKPAAQADRIETLAFLLGNR